MNPMNPMINILDSYTRTLYSHPILDTLALALTCHIICSRGPLAFLYGMGLGQGGARGGAHMTVFGHIVYYTFGNLHDLECDTV